MFISYLYFYMVFPQLQGYKLGSVAVGLLDKRIAGSLVEEPQAILHATYIFWNVS